MKRIFCKLNGKNLATAAFLTGTVLLTTITKSSAKNTLPDIEIISADTSAKVAFLGSSDNGLLFNVALKNDKGWKFILTIKNESGEILFIKEYTDVNFDKNFKVLKSENGISYYFSIKSENKNIEQTFAVKTFTKEIEDVVVTKL